jgi:HSP20 family molecular chaperone IbpA
MFGKKKKKTLIERLTGAIHLDEEDDFDYEEDAPQSNRGTIHHPSYDDSYNQNNFQNQPQQNTRHMHFSHAHMNTDSFEDTSIEDIGELSVDVINSSDAIIVKAMIAGVKPSDIDVDITRDTITLKATRADEHEIEEENFHMRELYWGTFARTITLPEEVDVDLADAKEKHGLLVINLPKLDKHRKAKLQIKSN